MITCEPYHATISENTCIARHKLINQKHHKGNGKNWGNSGEKTLRNEACVSCQVGIDLYQRSLEGGKFKMAEKPETKTCPCGKKFARTPDQPLHAWNRAKYCSEHSAMTSYQRDKLFGKKAQAEPNNTKSAVKVEAVSVPEKAPTYICSVCGKDLPLDTDHFQKNRGNPNGFDTGCKECRNKQKRARRAERKPVGFDMSRVQEIAREVAADEIAYLASVGVDIEGLPQPLCERIAVEACRRVMGAA